MSPGDGPDPRSEGTAQRIARGVRRLLAAQGWASLQEVTLASGLRADLLALGPDGGVVIVEVKSGVADFRADRKWTGYTPFCDRFYFAVDESFPAGLIPESCGLIVADAYEAAVLREPAATPLNAARRRAMLLAFARTAAARLHRLEDPGMALDGWGRL